MEKIFCFRKNEIYPSHVLMSRASWNLCWVYSWSYRQKDSTSLQISPVSTRYIENVPGITDVSKHPASRIRNY